ncbi:MAG: transglutaminase-like domain-containing protein, partial [Gemmatimonadota bacterium]
VHVDREYGRSEAVRLGEAAVRLSPTAAYYTVSLANRPVGFAASLLDTLPDGFRLTDDFRLFVEALGMSGEARLRTQMELSPRLALRGFRFLLDSELGRFEVEGVPEGDSVLEIRVRTAGDDQRMRVATEGPIVLPALLPLRLVLGGEPEIGRTYTFSIFDPSVLDSRPTEVRILGRERLIVPDSAIYDSTRARWVPASFDTVSTWHVSQTYGGVTVESWLDPDGLVVRATSPLGYAMERTAFEMAWNNLRAAAARGELTAGAPDIIERTAVASNVDLGSIARRHRLGVRIRNVELEGFALSGDRQRLAGDTLWVAREDPADLEPGYALPADPSRFARELAAEPLVQANDPEIRAQAERIAAGSRDPVQVASRLNAWVYGALEKRVTFSLPSARQVLDGRQGDCNEHTVLYVALARALGLPARTATGLVYVRRRFYYHAWPEVWLGRWVAVDPTFGQFPADAAHLRFVVGGLADQVQLLRLIGRVELEVVDAIEGRGEAGG